MALLQRVLHFLFLMLISGKLFAQSDSARSKTVAFRETQAVGKPFPLFYVKAGSETWTNDSLKGKVVFINFWFENCPPCVAEMRPMNELYQKLKDSAKVAFLSLSFETPEKLKWLKEKYGIQYNVATISRSECYRLNQDNGFPTTIILDQNGIIKFLKAGGYVDKEKVEHFLNEEVYHRILAELQVKP
jgi:cytochrome c biogenesis protein CcmG, thiol:disulfide interchange protein DsbE